MTLSLTAATKIYLACGSTDMRKGFDGLYSLIKQTLQLDPLVGHIFLFRGKSGTRLKAVYWDGSGICLFAKRLETGTKFVWPMRETGVVEMSSAQLALLIDGFDWRRAIAPYEPPHVSVT